MLQGTIDDASAIVLRLRRKPAERARLLDRLIESLDHDAEAEAAWDAEADRRDNEIESGQIKTSPMAETIARLEARFPG